MPTATTPGTATGPQKTSPQDKKRRLHLPPQLHYNFNFLNWQVTYCIIIITMPREELENSDAPPEMQWLAPPPCQGPMAPPLLYVNIKQNSVVYLLTFSARNFYG